MPSQRQLAESVIERLRQAGHEAVLAGGCVRDLILGRTAKDYDVATSAPPQAVLDLYPDALTVGQAFGVVIVRDGAMQVEVATFRSDAPYTDGRHPDAVTFTDARHDALRRDFTINAMFLDPASGEIIDHVGGRKDLKRRTIRAVGDPRVRFAEDHLRMLRAVRFAAELGFDIERATAGAIRDLAAKIARVSGERIAAELARLLTAPPAGRRRGLQLADQLGLLPVILPEVHATHGTDQGPNVHPEGDVFVHTVLCVEQLREPTFELALAALLHDVGKPRTAMLRDGKWTFYGHATVGEDAAGEVCRRLRLSNYERRRVTWLVRQHMNLLNWDQMREARLKRLFAHDGFDELAELWRADCLASGGTADEYEALMVRYRAMGRHQIRPAPLVSGRDLIDMGLEPGPVFREILDQVYDAQLEGRVAAKADALDLARQVAQAQCNPDRC
ncbi:MAG TPA: CCA tRNA nucleotidyltransferase [Phycisphaerae bacterium]|nr:CCA tRNA nucleotidyltransferase [Phycisphaerae bacterium]